MKTQIDFWVLLIGQFGLHFFKSVMQWCETKRPAATLPVGIYERFSREPRLRKVGYNTYTTRVLLLGAGHWASVAAVHTILEHVVMYSMYKLKNSSYENPPLSRKTAFSKKSAENIHHLGKFIHRNLYNSERRHYITIAIETSQIECLTYLTYREEWTAHVLCTASWAHEKRPMGEWTGGSMIFRLQVRFSGGILPFAGSHNLSQSLTIEFELSFSFRFTCHLTVLLFDHALSRAHHWYTTQKLSGWKINYFCFFSRFPSFAVASNIFWAQSLAVESTYSILRRLILKAFLFKRYLFSGFSECFAHRHTQGRVYTDTIWK